MKKKQVKIKKEEKKLKRWQVMAMWSILGAAVVAISLSIILPIIKINNDLEKLVDKMSEHRDSTITITDMSAENVFGGQKGEAMLVSSGLLDKLCNVSEDMRYKGKETDSIGTWDIRFRVNGGEIYVTVEGIYYTSNNVKYRFVPKNDEARTEYEVFYKEIEALLK